ncbi:High Affinity Immunoglobulin Epsilon Receptor Subunit Alpha [Manis pentadactyla]|nr:High Affinity Immunoglobulin Epsilon Receptor Subunit Alpha [Manis pentadactyla]
MARLSFRFVISSMTDVEVDYVSSETLALRKELGSGSDVKGEQDGGSGFGEAWVTSMFLNGSITEELGSGSDVKGEQDGGSGFGECAIQFQDYSEARVISMMTVEFHATVRR